MTPTRVIATTSASELATRPGSVAVERRVEWVDTDASGHHHNSAVMRWFEVAEARLLDQRGILHDVYGHLPRVRTEVDFLRSVRFGEEIEMEAWVDEVGSSSVAFGFEMRADGGVAARGSVVAALLDEDGSPRPWPDPWRRALEGDVAAG